MEQLSCCTKSQLRSGAVVENIMTLSLLVLIKDSLFYVKLMSSNDSPAPEAEVKLPVLYLH